MNKRAKERRSKELFALREIRVKKSEEEQRRGANNLQVQVCLRREDLNLGISLPLFVSLKSANESEPASKPLNRGEPRLASPFD